MLSKMVGTIKTTVLDTVTGIFGTVQVADESDTVIIGGKYKTDKITATEILLEAIRVAEQDVAKLPNQDTVKKLWKEVVHSRDLSNGLGGRDPMHALRARCANISLLTKICVFLHTPNNEANKPKVMRCLEMLIREHAALIVGIRYYGSNNSIGEAAISMSTNLRTHTGYLVRARKYMLAYMWNMLPELTRDERFRVVEHLASMEFPSIKILWASIAAEPSIKEDKLHVLNDTKRLVESKLRDFANTELVYYRNKITYPLGISELQKKASEVFYYGVLQFLALGAEAADASIKERQNNHTNND